MSIIILGIESSCDDTSAAIAKDCKILANIVATQTIHEKYGGVVPELASRDHQKNIIPVVEEALKTAGVDKKEISAIAFARAPGLMGSLLVGCSFSKAFALGLNVPLIEANHLQSHILAHFIQNKKGDKNFPRFPFLCLLVSGGHTQIIRVDAHLKMEILGKSLDDAAGEAFDKAGKVFGLTYPAGHMIDKLAMGGNPKAFNFPHPDIPGLDFSFSGLKTSLLYLVKDEIKKDKDFIEKNKADLCASYQNIIVEVLMKKLKLAAAITGIKEIAIAGGVSANSFLQKTLKDEEKKSEWKTFIPQPEYCTDNAAMIAIIGYYKYINKEFCEQSVVPLARV
ncbi:MAG: tRNA (adenosine(37)-N6)-threonylcarbamoyltransferase complex transferase subunit TsaD [Bacteroidales bacterium]|nr:tRNA (adenosine(37)-N6)-threonylcarbamoyltransferase complex transferase subunit TsaD [Bacteroidales bacterium]